MRIVLAPDSYKGCLPALQVARSMALGCADADPACQTRLAPMADGGEGTAEVIVAARRGTWISVPARDPIGRAVAARYGRCGDIAVMEMAAASGLERMAGAPLEPLRASSFGAGQLLRHAVAAGCTRVLMGIGGSATNDGGLGLLMALGARFLDAAGNPLPPAAASLAQVAAVDFSGMIDLSGVALQVACDVSNPLCGPEGATAVYGPQKGVTPEQIPMLDAALAHYASVLEAAWGDAFGDRPGAGAAGGLGFALYGLGARLERGSELVAQAVDLDGALRGADLVITGEGATDEQTAYGKAVQGVARRARAQGVPVVCLSGALLPGCEALYAEGVSALFAIADRPLSLEQSLQEAPALIRRASANLLRLFRAGR